MAKINKKAKWNVLNPLREAAKFIPLISHREAVKQHLTGWTFMVYIAGDNNLDPAALKDIAEMAKVGSSEDLNIIVQLDRARDRKTRRFYITKSGGYQKDCVETFDETNTGDPAVLEDFILWGMEKYPASRYALVIWNHGGGWWNEPERVYHVADDLRPTIHYFISRLCEAAGIALMRRHFPYRPAYLAACLADLMRRIGFRAPIMLSRPYVIHTGRTWTFDDRRIRREIGYQRKVTMNKGFERLAVWIQTLGGIKAALRRQQ